MKEQCLKDLHAKRLYEEYCKEEISTRTWQRTKKMMKSLDMGLTKSNLQVVAKLKKSAPQIKTPLNKVLACYVKASQLPTLKGSIKGEFLYSELARITGYKADRTTITRWLSILPNKFSRDKTYNAIDLPLVYLAAYTYKPRNKKCC